MAMANSPKKALWVNLTSRQMEVILEGCKSNDRLAQKELYSQFYELAVSIASKFTSEADNISEITNDSFLKVFTHLKNFIPRHDNVTGTFAAWFKQVIVYTCIDYLRKYGKAKMIDVNLTDAIPLEEGLNGEDILGHKEILNQIHYLSPAYRAVFNLYIIEGYSHAEIAEQLNISEGTSKSNLHKARKNLRELFGKNRKNSYERAFL